MLKNILLTVILIIVFCLTACNADMNDLQKLIINSENQIDHQVELGSESKKEQNMNKSDFEIEISVNKTSVAPNESIIITATFRNMSDNKYQITAGRSLICFSIREEKDERIVYASAVVSYRVIEKKFLETKTIEYHFENKGTYCIGANVKFYILSTNCDKEIEYDKIKASELEKLRDSGNFIYLITEEIIINVE